MRTYNIYHWRRPGTKPVPEAYRKDSAWWVDVEDIHAFAEQHGPIQLRPPTEAYDFWAIYVTDSTKSFR
jgi:hypothetical protein